MLLRKPIYQHTRETQLNILTIDFSGCLWSRTPFSQMQCCQIIYVVVTSYKTKQKQI